MNHVSLIIGADIVPTSINIHLFENGDVQSLVGEKILNILFNADLRVFNLECPLTDNEFSISKSSPGPHLHAKTTAINGIKALNPNLLTLANNHNYDHGEQGLNSTLEILKHNEIPFIGVNSNEYFLEKNGIKIGVYACAEHEYNVESSFFDPLETPDKISELKQKCDYVIVLYHGGKEYYRYPSPLLQKRFRKMAEKGANLVVAQHTHCVGCYEKYLNSTLVYGQGNFIFEKHKNKIKGREEFWNSSLLIKANISKEDFAIEYIPISKNCDEKQILDGFEKRSSQILEENFVANEYEKFAQKYIDNYLMVANGSSIVLRIVKKLFWKHLPRMFYSKQGLMVLNNSIQCEAHRELFLSGLKALISKKVQ